MRELTVKYMAFNMPHQKNWPYDTPIGLIHDYLFKLCNTYVITEITYKNN